MFTFNPPAEAQDRRVRVINNTGQIMVRLQASNVNRRTWEEDILGRNVYYLDLVTGGPSARTTQGDEHQSTA